MYVFKHGALSFMEGGRGLSVVRRLCHSHSFNIRFFLRFGRIIYNNNCFLRRNFQDYSILLDTRLLQYITLSCFTSPIIRRLIKAL